MWRVTYDDGSTRDVEHFYDGAVKWEGRNFVKIERLPEPEKARAIVYVQCDERDPRRVMMPEDGIYYRRVEVDLETAILRGLNATGVQHGPTVLAAITKSIRRSIEGGA